MLVDVGCKLATQIIMTRTSGEECAGHRSTLAFLRNRGNWNTQAHTGRIVVDNAAHSKNICGVSEQLASVFTSTLPATKRKRRTISTRTTDVIFERKHCSRRRSHTQVEITSPHKQLGNSETIGRNRWHGARIS